MHAGDRAGADRAPRRPGGDSAPLRALAVLLAAAVVAIYVHGATGYPLAEPDETRYAEIGREMVESGEWIAPHLNYVPFIDKPPLVYWATALSFTIAGQHELAARLPSLLAGFATLLLTAALATRMYGGATALLAVAVLAWAPLFAFLAVVLTLDMSLTACTTLALAAVWGGWRRGGDRRWVRVAYAATALGVLVKGPVAVVLVAGIAVPFLLAHGGWRALRPWCDWRGLALAVAIALPWFVLVGWRYPEFWHAFVVEHHLQRFTVRDQHREPPWFLVPVLVAGLAPWSAAVLLDPGLLRSRLDVRRWAPATRFLALWAAVIVVFFSLSQSKLMTYVLPALPPLAILLARLLLAGAATGRTAGLARLGWVLLIGGPILGLVAAVLPWIDDHYRVPLIVPLLFAAAAPLFVAGLATRVLLTRRRPYAAMTALAAGWALVFTVAVSGRAIVNQYRDMGLVARAALGPDDRLALYGNFVPGMVYYPGRRAVMIGRPGELTFGSRQSDAPEWFWPSDNAWIDREWAGPRRLLVFMKRQDLDRLRPLLVPPPIELASKDKKVLIANR